MPELPDLTVYLECLERRVQGRRLLRLHLFGVSLLRTVDPPPAEAEGRRVRERWDRAGSGDPETFSRALVQLHYIRPGPSYDLFFGTPVRRRHSESFLGTFDRLLRAAEDVDPQGLITDALRNSGHGLLHRIMVEQRDRPPAADAAR